MNLIILIIIFLGVNFNIHGQISISDSTVQVIGYWDNDEKQSYIVTTEKYRVRDTDTTNKEFWKYLVDISIVDSTNNSYTIEWFYHDYEIQTDNELTRKLSSIVENVIIRIKTDELGIFLEVENWQEIRDFLYKATSMLKKEYENVANIDKIVEQVEVMFSSKAAIEAGVIKEIIQFYSFHGIKYKLGEEITTSMQLPNLFGGEPLDTEVLIWLDKINIENDDYIIRMVKTVNSEQLTRVTYEYLTKISKGMNKEIENLNKLMPIHSEIWTTSQIHNSGWIIYSIETKETTTEGIVHVEERVIEITE